MADTNPGTIADRRWTFNRIAGTYEAGRPPYPDRVYQVMADLGVLGPGSRVLEIGPGTGQATVQLLARGATVHAVELGAGLADRLRQRLPHPRLDVTVADIHEVPLAAATYDTVVAATTFHWLDAPALLPKLAAALRPGGWLVIWWTVFGDPEADTPFRRAVDLLYRERMPHEWHPRDEIPRAMRVEERLAELTDGGYFADPHHELIRWHARFDREAAMALFATFPNVQELAPDRRRSHLAAIGDMVDAEGGWIDDPYVTAVYAVRRMA